MVLCDFHIHTHYSIDGTMSPETLIEACLEVGLNCIAVTDHDTIEGALAVQRIAPFQVIIGEEVSSRDGHIIGLFLKRAIEPGLSAEETVSQIKRQGALAIAPHPFSRFAGQDACGAVLEKNPSLFDAIETANANHFLKEDDVRAKVFAESHGLTQIAGSDSHHRSGIGSTRVKLAAFDSPETLLTALHTAEFDHRPHPLHYFAQALVNQVYFRVRHRVLSPDHGRSPLFHQD